MSSGATSQAETVTNKCFKDASYKNSMPLNAIVERFGARSGRDGKISCPLHQDKSPSLHIYDDHAYCFSCNTRFDSYSLVGAFLLGNPNPRGESFISVKNWLAEQTGLPKVIPKLSKPGRDNCSRIEDPYEEVWRDALRAPGLAHTYLESRSISRKTCEGLVGYLRQDYQFRDSEIASKAGLLSKSGRFLFAGRAIFAVRRNGRIVSFYGRAIHESIKPSHANCGLTDPPQPRTMFNIDQCRNFEDVYLTESVIDLLTLVDRGLSNVIALFGVQGLTPDRIELLKETSIQTITICFDSDRNGTGQRSALEQGLKLFQHGFEVSVKTLPLEKDSPKVDINSFLSNREIDQFHEVETQPFLELYLGNKGRNPEAVADKLEKLYEAIANKGPLIADHYLDRIKSVTGFKKRQLVAELKKKTCGDADYEKPGGFHPLDYVDLVVEQTPTIYVDGTFYQYADGYYQQAFEEEIGREVVRLIGADAQAHQVKAVAELLSIKCFTRTDDVNPQGLLNIGNGIINIETGDCLNHSPDFRFTFQNPIRLEETARCPVWLETVKDIIPDQDARFILQELFGFCLTTDVWAQKAFVFYGQGSNGKSVILDVLENLVGNENVSAVHLAKLGDRFKLAELQNKLVNISPEVSSKELVNDSIFKALVTGDPVTAERKFKEPFKFRNFAKLITAGNNLPPSSDGSYGYLRHWIIIPFTQRFGKDDSDPQRARRIIVNEMSGVLKWALEGLNRLRKNQRFTASEICDEAIRDYQRNLEPIVEFIADRNVRVLAGEEHFRHPVRLNELYVAYQDWAQRCGYRPLGRNRFSRGIEKHLAVKAERDRDGMFFRKLGFHGSGAPVSATGAIL
jgi:putative DNA primase/helicase